MAANDDNVVRNCASRARNNAKHCHKRKKQLYLTNEPLEFVAKDPVRTFPKTVQGSLYILVITDRYSRLTWAISTLKTTATHVANLFMHQWLILYNISTYFLTNDGTQLVNRFFATLCTLLGVKHFTTTA